MRVAITTDSFRDGMGGVATAVAALARTLRAAGHTVRIFTAADPSHATMELDVAGFPALHYERLPGGRVVVAPVGLARELAAFRPDVIHNHSMAAMGTQALAAARLLDIPILGTCHVYLAGFLGYAPLPLDRVPLMDEAAWRYTVTFFNLFPLVTTPSQVMARELAAHGLRVPVVAVSNGVDTSLFRPGPRVSGKDSVTVLHVGRLSYEKNVDLLLRAFARIAGDYPAARLTIAGDGPDRAALTCLAGELGLGERVHFTGFVPHEQLPALYQAADLFATASTIETQGLVVLEAMACGLPVAGVDALALPEAVHHSVNGFLAPPGDEAALAQHLACLIADAGLRQRMGAASCRLAERHSLEQIVAQYERLYRQVAAARPPSFPPAWMRRGGWLWGAVASGVHTVRGWDFLSRLLDLYREARAPVHYVDLAQSLDVSPVTAYEMLHLLEDKGLVRSETVRPQGRRGRSVIVFSPTERATTLLAELTGSTLNEQEWEEAKTGILEALEKEKGTDYQDLLNELLLRIPERKSPLLFAADMVAVIILVFYELRDTEAAKKIFPSLRWSGPPGWAAPYSLAGFGLALSLVEKANRRATSLLLSYSQQFHEHLDNLTGEDKARLSDFAYDVLRAVGL